VRIKRELRHVTVHLTATLRRIRLNDSLETAYGRRLSRSGKGIRLSRSGKGIRLRVAVKKAVKSLDRRGRKPRDG